MGFTVPQPTSTNLKGKKSSFKIISRKKIYLLKVLTQIWYTKQFHKTLSYILNAYHLREKYQWHGSSSRLAALQAQSPEFTP
jgi:hypothetical protein